MTKGKACAHLTSATVYNFCFDICWYNCQGLFWVNCLLASSLCDFHRLFFGFDGGGTIFIDFCCEWWDWGHHWNTSSNIFVHQQHMDRTILALEMDLVFFGIARDLQEATKSALAFLNILWQLKAIGAKGHVTYPPLNLIPDTLWTPEMKKAGKNSRTAKFEVCSIGM